MQLFPGPKVALDKDPLCIESLWVKDFRASGLGQVRRLTAATAAITPARLFVETLCYILGRLYSSCVLSKVEIFLEQREVAFLSPSKICENLNFSTVHL